MRLHALISLAALAAVGALSFYGFKEFFDNKSGGVEYLESYTKSKGSFIFTGVPQIDYFLSLMIYMFRDHFMTNELQIWIFSEWAAVFAVLCWLDVEFTRTQMRFIWFYFFAWNFLGLAPFLAIVLCYYIFAKERQISTGRPDREVSTLHSLLTLARVAVAIGAPIFLRLVPVKSMEYAYCILVCMAVPTLVDVIWVLMPTAPVGSSREDGFLSSTIMRVSFLIVAIAGAYIHLQSTYYLLRDFGGVLRIVQTQGSELLPYLAQTATQKLISHYDAPLSFASVYIFIAYDGGILSMLSSLFTSLLFSPAVAFALYFSRRGVYLGSSSKKHQ